MSRSNRAPILNMGDDYDRLENVGGVYYWNTNNHSKREQQTQQKVYVSNARQDRNNNNDDDITMQLYEIMMLDEQACNNDNNNKTVPLESNDDDSYSFVSDFQEENWETDTEVTQYNFVDTTATTSDDNWSVVSLGIVNDDDNDDDDDSSLLMLQDDDEAQDDDDHASTSQVSIATATTTTTPIIRSYLDVLIQESRPATTLSCFPSPVTARAVTPQPLLLMSPRKDDEQQQEGASTIEEQHLDYYNWTDDIRNGVKHSRGGKKELQFKGNPKKKTPRGQRRVKR